MKQMTLDEVKKVQLDILKYVDMICKKNNIQYSLAYGTLLGAVRHGGFIPWDDDIDIVLMRGEYDKLLQYLYVEQDDTYQVVSMKDEGYWYTYAKVTDKRTFIKEKNWPSYEKLGVNIDIFPLDFLPEINPKDLFDKAMDINKRLAYCLTDIAYKDEKFYKRCIKKICRFGEVKKCRKHDEWYWKDLFENIVSKTKTSNYIAEIVAEPYNMWNAQWMESFTELQFEDSMFRVSKYYKEMLQKDYGNYMKLPSKEERVSNHDFTPFWR